jgi:hypothetical protein
MEDIFSTRRTPIARGGSLSEDKIKTGKVNVKMLMKKKGPQNTQNTQKKDENKNFCVFLCVLWALKT